jgi:DNA-binding HxlR family transcriptional regulator
MVTIESKQRICPADILDADCPTRQVLDLIADKWTTLLVVLLSGGTKRFGEIQRSVGGISQKMLTQTLRRMEEDGFVTRVIYPEIPPRTEYSLTPLGISLKAPLCALSQWAIEHLAEVENAREVYGRKNGPKVLSA